MNLVNMMLYILSEYINLLSAIIVMKIFFTKISNQSLMLICIFDLCILFTSTFGLNNHIAYIQLSALNTIAQFLLLMLVIREKFMKKFFVLVLAFVFQAVVESFVVFILHLSADNLTHLEMTLMSFLCLISTVFVYFINNKFKIKETSNFLIFNLLIGLSTGLFPLLAVELFKDKVSTSMYYSIVVISFITMLATFFAYFFFNSLKTENERILNESILRESMLQMQSAYTDTVLEKYESIRAFRHDIKSYFILIEDMLNKKRYDDLQDFIAEVRKKNDNDAIIDCGNIYISALINQFSYESKEKEINFNFIYQLNQDLTLDKFEICSLFYNLLTNAIEAAGKAQSNKHINVQLNSINSSLQIVLENSVSSEFCLDTIILHKTTKGNTKNHGIGLYTINSIIDSYHGDIQYRLMDNVLHTSIVLLNCIKYVDN